MSLYRKYRPQAFSDVAGQSHIVSTLEQAVAQDKLAHAYLFCGTRGTGKTSTARILAKTLLTRGISDAVRREQIIKGVEEGTLVDLVEIDAASNRGIDDIRSLLEKIQFSPLVGSAKVYIVDEVHMLTREAFNALLKTLEEPPPYAYFILATTELHKIPATIQSRCQRFLFRQIHEEDIVARMRFVAQCEHIQIDDEALQAIAHHVQGGMRDAISLLDQLRSLPHVTLADVRERTGESGQEHVETVLAALDASDAQTLLKTVRTLEQAGVPLDTFLRLLLTACRTRLHAAIEAKQSTQHQLRMLDALLAAIRDVRMAPVPGLVVESALLSLCESPRAAAPATTPKAAPAPAPTAAAASAPAPASAPGAVTLAALREAWPEIVQTAEPASARMSMKNGRLHALEGHTLTLVFSSEFHREKASAIEVIHGIENALEKRFGARLTVHCVPEGEASPAAPQEAVDLAAIAGEIF